MINFANDSMFTVRGKLVYFLPEHTMLDLEGEFGLEEVPWPVFFTQSRLVRPGLNLEEKAKLRIYLGGLNLEATNNKIQSRCLLLPTNSRALSVAANLRRNKVDVR